jgi:hypothetical protein
VRQPKPPIVLRLGEALRPAGVPEARMRTAGLTFFFRFAFDLVQGLLERRVGALPFDSRLSAERVLSQNRESANGPHVISVLDEVSVA